MVKEEQSGFKKAIQSQFFKGASIAVVAALLGSGVTYLAVHNGNSADSAIVTMKGDKITISDFYEAAKNTSSSQQSLLTVILGRVFEAKYGDKVSDEDVNAAYNKTASSYGSSFSSALSSAGLTEDTYKAQIRTTKLVEYAVAQAAKKQLTTKNYKAAYETYNPDTTAQVIKLSDETTANSVLSQVKADGADFATIAKNNTTESNKTVDYTFDSADTDLPSDVMTAAFNQSEGSVSDVIKVLDSSTYSYTYYIVKTTKKTTKDANWETYKKRLKKALLAKYESDSSFQNQVIAKALDEANVKVKDKAFSSLLAQYATSSSSSSTTSSSSTKDSSTTSSSSSQ